MTGCEQGSGGRRWSYPILAACVGDQRAPSRGEVRQVAARLWREAFGRRFGPEPGGASFALRRILMRAAAATLTGRPSLG